ncbi:AlpA family phage regulatory protein [Chitinibacter fontanus]|uniref:AlpA family phage regulatory protein n=1 Tax=Chitinibacter fontanus TaxID=1737446 RepID=A0A7D5VB17_9NEIS|nr:AlpA family phage regulatory protein [Chitinibacter fontanus]QLI82659.1 AlpA family phage regulatory protein [Chitinibacter fontanus]
MQIVRVKELCKRLSLSRSTVYNLINAGAFHPIKLGSRAIGFDLAEIEAYLKKNRST